MFRILVVDDDKNTRILLKAVLEAERYTVFTAENGEEALRVMEGEHIDLVVLDIMMPKMDGLTVLRRIREEGNTLPVLLLTAKSEIDDRVEGLDSGADDYLTKPFAAKELLARIRAMTRRHPNLRETMLSFENVMLDAAEGVLRGPKGILHLGNKEFQMMEMLMLNPGWAIPTERFLEKIWGYETDSGVNTVWVYISGLRKKLAEVGACVQIRTSRGVGYYLEKAE